MVAVEHSILTATWNMISNNQTYNDVGSEHHSRRDPTAAIRRITRQANGLGLTVRFDPIEQRS